MGRMQLFDPTGGTGNYMPTDPNTSVAGNGDVYAQSTSPYSAGDSPGVYSNGGFWGGSAQPDPVAQAPSFAGTGGGVDTSIPSGGPGGGGIPAPQPAPVMSPDQWLAGDSTFQGQQNDYNQQLKSFLDRLNQQKSDYQQDFGTAQNAFNQNRDRNLLSLGEDWTSRGMANSGLFNQARDLANRDYQNQQQGMNTANSRALANFTQQGNDRQSEINQAIENARQQSLARMAANQSF